MAAGNLPDNSAPHAKQAQETLERKHRAICSICKRDDCALIEEDYLTGASVGELLRRWKMQRRNWERHCAFFRLRERRDYSSRRMIHRMLDRVNLENVDVDNPQLLLGILRLNAQIGGELTEKVELGGGVDVRVQAETLVQNLIKKIGGLPSEPAESDGE